MGIAAATLVSILIVTSPSGAFSIRVGSPDTCKELVQKLEKMSAEATHTCPAHSGGCWSDKGTSLVSVMCAIESIDEAWDEPWNTPCEKLPDGMLKCAYRGGFLFLEAPK